MGALQVSVAVTGDDLGRVYWGRLPRWVGGSGRIFGGFGPVRIAPIADSLSGRTGLLVSVTACNIMSVIQ
jgi:hypothetical protein